ncbi:MAG: hypothetical protein C4526_10775 [Nitrospiraceae bacterium]|nr:MAG: hypothetical protein C4526_10775 [Nitrospiraceae bacterium]
MAADSRVTEGYTLEGPKTRDDSVKFIQLDRDFGVMTHGIYDIGGRGINALKERVDGQGRRIPGPAEFVSHARDILRDVDNEWSGRNPDVVRRDKDTGFIIGGFDRRETSFSVYSLESPEFVPKTVNGNLFMAGQWHIAKFLAARLNNMRTDVNVMKGLAAILIMATAEVDKTVGGPVRIASITGPKGFQWADDDEMKKLLDFNESFREHFQGLLESSLNAVSADNCFLQDNEKINR